MERSLNKHLRRLKTLRSQLDSINQNKIKEPLRVMITGATGNIGYSLVFMIAQGRLLGADQPIILHLFDLASHANQLKGLTMELLDGAFELLKGIVPTTDPSLGFKDIDIAIMCGAKPRGPGMERKDLLTANAKIFEEQGKYFDKYAKKNVKVCVVGNPANTNALILAKNAPTIDSRNFTALTRLDHNRAISQLADRLKVDNARIKNITIWGNHSATQYPDIDYAVIENNDFGNITTNTPVKSLINDDKYVQNEYIKIVQQRGAAIIAARKLSSAASAASAICDHVRDWVNGTAEVYNN